MRFSAKPWEDVTLLGLVLTIAIFLTGAFALSGHAAEFKLPGNPGPKSFDSKVIDAFVSSGSPGILSAFKGDPDLHATELQLSYYMKEGGEFRADYMIGNHTARPLEYEITCLIDYQQQEFQLDDKLSRVHRLQLTPGERKTSTLKIASVERGAHDFLLLAVTSKKNPRPSEPESILLYHRANIFAGGYSFPATSWQKLREETSRSRALQIVVNKEADMGNFRPLFDDRRSPSAESKYYLHLSNPKTEALRLTVLLLQKSSAVSDIRVTPLYYALNPGMDGALGVMLPVAARTDSILAVMVENPYVKLEPEPGTMTRIPTQVRPSNTITLNYDE